MDIDPLFLTLLVLAGIALWRARERQRRIRLLNARLAPFHIERLMEQLSEGYLRCLDEPDLERREQRWQWLGAAEQQLQRQFTHFAAGFAEVDARHTRFAPRGLRGLLWPVRSLDLRELLALHARGISLTVENRDGLSRRDRAYRLCAELFLMQHSCHWFCRSHAVASARLLARHRSSHAQVLAAVSARTRRDYLQLTGDAAAPTGRGTSRRSSVGN